MKTYIVIEVNRAQAGRIGTDVTEFMGKGYEPFGGLVAVGDRLIQPMILTNWKEELGIDGNTRHAIARHQADLGREARTGEQHLEEQPQPSDGVREEGLERE